MTIQEKLQALEVVIEHVECSCHFENGMSVNDFEGIFLLVLWLMDHRKISVLAHLYLLRKYYEDLRSRRCLFISYDWESRLKYLYRWRSELGMCLSTSIGQTEES